MQAREEWIVQVHFLNKASAWQNGAVGVRWRMQMDGNNKI